MFASPLKTASTRCMPLPSAVGAIRTTRMRATAAPTSPSATGASHPMWGHLCAHAMSASRQLSAAISK